MLFSQQVGIIIINIYSLSLPMTALSYAKTRIHVCVHTLWFICKQKPLAEVNNGGECLYLFNYLYFSLF